MRGIAPLKQWYANALAAMDEGALRPEEGLEAYRLLWLRTFHAPVVIHVQRLAGLTTLTLKEPRSQTDRTLSLRDHDWERLTAALATFWTRPSHDDAHDGRDGARWVIEGIRGDAYHLVDRWCLLDLETEKELAAAARLLLALAQLVVPARELY